MFHLRRSAKVNPVVAAKVYSHYFGDFGHTPWKINMEPENGGLEDDFPFQLGDF